MRIGDTLATDALAAGDVVSEKYEIVRVLGRGGMGIVYLAVHQRLGHRVAIKTLVPEAVADVEACLRFEREARAVAKLKNRFVAKVTDVETLPDGSPAMVMEFLEGHTLGHELELCGRMPVGAAVDCLLQVCSALQEAHAVGIIHRDIKPENIFLADEAGERVAKVLDFGISKLIDPDERRVTTTGLVLGTPMYMSPEQIRATKAVDHRCDIWAIGVVLYEALTGRPPFEGLSSAAVIAAITVDDPRSPHEWEDDIPVELSLAVMKALAKSPDMRHADVAEFAAAIQPFARAFEFLRSSALASLAGVPPRASGGIVAGNDLATSGDGATVSALFTDRAWAGEAQRTSNRRRSLLVGAALSLVVVGIGVALTLGSGPGVAAGVNAATLTSSPSSVSAFASASTPVTPVPSASMTPTSSEVPATTAGPRTLSLDPRERPARAPAHGSTRIEAAARTTTPSAAPPTPSPARTRPVAGDGQPLNL